MIIVNLKGGLGNQMFQYATGFALAKRKQTNLLFDIRLQEEYKINPPPRNVPRDIDLDVFFHQRDHYFLLDAYYLDFLALMVYKHITNMYFDFE